MGVKITLWSLLAIVVMLGISWLAMGNQFFLAKVFNPKMEQVRRDTFEQSKAYNQGMIQELRSSQICYIQADASGKAALKSIVLHQFADYDINKLPPDLYEFLKSLQQSEKGSGF